MNNENELKDIRESLDILAGLIFDFNMKLYSEIEELKQKVNKMKESDEL